MAGWLLPGVFLIIRISATWTGLLLTVSRVSRFKQHRNYQISKAFSVPLDVYSRFNAAARSGNRNLFSARNSSRKKLKNCFNGWGSLPGLLNICASLPLKPRRCLHTDKQISLAIGGFLCAWPEERSNEAGGT